MRAAAVFLRRLPQPLPAAYQHYFGVRLRRGPSDTISFSREDAERPFLTSDEHMWTVFEPELRRRLMDLDERSSTAERVRSVLLELLPSGRGTLEGVAKKLSISTRTLQRRLLDEGIPFQDVLNATRKDLALHYVKRTRLSFAEVAFLLGYASISSFFRAFQAWTGTTPALARSDGVSRQRR